MNRDGRLNLNKRRVMIRAREIGEQFRMGGVLYKVAEATSTDDPCVGCSLNNGKSLICRGDVGVTGFCYEGMRRDGKQAVFIEVSEDEKPLDSLLDGDFSEETTEG